MPVHLVRHAHAGSRARWPHDDVDRPLTPKGTAQARSLGERLADVPVTLVASSPAERCRQTAEAIASVHGIDVELRPELAEGEPLDVAMQLVRRLAGSSENPVLVGHGDLLPRILRELADPALSDGLGTFQKGSMWVVEVGGLQRGRGRYEPPASVDEP